MKNIYLCKAYNANASIIRPIITGSKNSFFCMLILMLFLPFFASSQTNLRFTGNFDFDWKFSLGDIAGAQAVDYDDANWQDVQLPHDWSIKLPVDKKNGSAMGFFPGGIGWYRKTFPVAAGYKGKKLVIQFDGVYHQSDVYINGKHLGFHPYGYSSFEYDLTPYVNYGKDNVLTVRVDHSNSPSSRWYSGSGIYRHVWLRITNPVHVATWGTYITTPGISESGADVKIATAIDNNAATRRKVLVVNRILNAAGEEVATSQSILTVEANKKGTAMQMMHVQSPTLWSIEKPYLYRMETTVKIGNEIADQYQSSFGIRSIHFDAGKGFFLNDKTVKLKGVCLHQDAGALGTAVPDGVYLRRLQILKEYGCNAIRCSHNSPSAELLNMCDSLGFVVIDEAFDKWKSGYYAKYFDDWWQRDMDAMLLRDRNHPSVILWCIGNETSEQNDTTEPTRPVTAAIAPGDVRKRIYNKNGFTEALDVVGLNYQEPWLLDDKKIFPARSMYVSEAFPYYRGRHNSARDYNPVNPWYDVVKNDFVLGQFIWSGIDYLGESSGWPSTGWPTGLFDECMFEKPRAAFHRSVWNATPMVRIAVADQSLNIDPGKDHWSWPHLAAHWNFPQYEGHIIDVQTTSNCDSVELWVNTQSMGRRRTADFTNNTIVWHVPYKAGKITAKGFNNGKETAQFELQTSGTPSQIKIIADKDQLLSNGEDVTQLMIQLTDDKGIPALAADKTLTVEVTGAGKLIALDNGDLKRENGYSSKMITTYFGKALAVVQSARLKGEIKVKVMAEGLRAAEHTLQAQ